MRILLFIILILTSCLSAQWTKVSDIEIGPNAKMASINGVVYAYGDEIFRSTDNGDSWEDVTSTFSDDLYFLHVHNGKLFAIIGINNVFVSEDNGFTWNLAGSVTLSGGNGAILTLHSDGNVLYALSNRASIFKSENEGSDWSEILIEGDGITNPIPLDFVVEGDLMVVTISNTGAVISSDAGGTWTVKNPAVVLGQVVKFNNEIYGASVGLYKLDSSNEWVDWNTGIPDFGGFYYTVKGMVVVGDKIYAALNSIMTGHIYTSDESAESWSETAVDLPEYITSTSRDFITYSNGELFACMYGIEAIAPGFTGIYKTSIDVSTSTEDVVTGIPTEFSLAQNYPNPFNPATTINFSLPEAGNFKLTLYDMLGRVSAIIAEGHFTAGYNNLNFNAEGLSSGVYIYALTGRSESGESVSISRKMMLLK